MNKRQFCSLLESIDDKYIIEYATHRKSRTRKFAFAAACFLLVFLSLAAIVEITRIKSPEMLEISSAAQYTWFEGSRYQLLNEACPSEQYDLSPEINENAVGKSLGDILLEPSGFAASIFAYAPAESSSLSADILLVCIEGKYYYLLRADE